MTGTEVAMTEWDDIEEVCEKSGKIHTGEFEISKHGYVYYYNDNDEMVKIPLSKIEWVMHK